MSIGITEDHVDLAKSLGSWAAGLEGLTRVRESETVPGEEFTDIWAEVAEFGIATIAAPEPAGGGGSVLDAAVALEAVARELVPGSLLGTAVAGALLNVLGAGAELAEAVVGTTPIAVGPEPVLTLDDRLTGSIEVVWDAPGAAGFLLGARAGDAERWFLVPAAAVTVTPTVSVDLTRRFGSVSVDADAAGLVEVPGLTAQLVRRMALTLAAAECSGIAQWCLDTAVAYAKVREQFGQPIGRFQAIKHLCVEMLERAEAITAAAADAAAAAGSGDLEQWAFAAEVAGCTALDGAVRVAQDCIQILGGIGFTFEHEAHFYLRRAVSLRNQLGPVDDIAVALARRAASGARRTLRVDLGDEAERYREEVRRQVAEIAARPKSEQRAALADSGLYMPHWPAPYGRDAGPVHQLVIDEELTAAGIRVPPLLIGAWAVATIVAHGSPVQQEQFVYPSLRGEIAWCQLFSEPGAGSDLAALRTRAERVDGGWRLTGQKVWTSLAREADWAICLARTDPDAPQHRGISYFLVDMKADGVDARPLREMTGDALFNEVFLDGVFVPDSHLVGEPGDGWRLARTTLSNERVAMASTKLGDSTETALALVAAGSPGLGAQARVGQAVALATVCAQLGVRTIRRSLSGAGPGPESSVAKLLTVRLRQDASELAVDLLGDRLLLGDPTATAAIHEMLLTRCLSIAGGTTQVLRNVAGERILGLPR